MKPDAVTVGTSGRAGYVNWYERSKTVFEGMLVAESAIVQPFRTLEREYRAVIID